jgi:hypothetical protein
MVLGQFSDIYDPGSFTKYRSWSTVESEDPNDIGRLYTPEQPEQKKVKKIYSTWAFVEEFEITAPNTKISMQSQQYCMHLKFKKKYMNFLRL